MKMLPPVGWADVATKRDIDDLRLEIEQVRTDLQNQMHFRFDAVDQRFEMLEHKVMGALHKEMTAQTWRLVTAATAMFGLFAVIVRL